MPLLLKVTLLGLVLIAGVYDLRFRRIPNWVSLSGVVLGAGLNTLLFGEHGLRDSGLGLSLAFAIYLPLYLVRGMGAGDVKLMAAVGAITGPQNWLQIFVATAIVGGVVSVVVVLHKHRLNQTLQNMRVIASELLHFRPPSRTDSRLDFQHRDSLRLPHAASIASGCMAYLLFGGWR